MIPIFFASWGFQLKTRTCEFCCLSTRLYACSCAHSYTWRSPYHCSRSSEFSLARTWRHLGVVLLYDLFSEQVKIHRVKCYLRIPIRAHLPPTPTSFYIRRSPSFHWNNPPLHGLGLPSATVRTSFHSLIENGRVTVCVVIESRICSQSTPAIFVSLCFGCLHLPFWIFSFDRKRYRSSNRRRRRYKGRYSKYQNYDGSEF